MGKFTLKGICLIFILVINFSLAQEDPKQFFPSSIGNVWVYDTPSGINRYRILKDSILQDSSRYIYYAINSDPVYRIDTSFNVFWIPTDSLLNWHYYELNPDLGDHWMVRSETSEVPRMEALVRAKYTSIFFGHQTTIMEITFYDLNWGDTVINEYSWPRFTESLAYGIGEIMYFDEEGGGPQKVLLGCIINGDTIGTITTATETEKIEPVEFELFQNYPNPFNPETKISYTITQTILVQIKVFDVLGDEIETLVNEEKPAGSYEVTCNAANLPSGVYFYQLRATPGGGQAVDPSTGSGQVFVQTKKMILLK